MTQTYEQGILDGRAQRDAELLGAGMEPWGVIIEFDDQGNAVVDHACEGPGEELNELDVLYTATQLAAARLQGAEEARSKHQPTLRMYQERAQWYEELRKATDNGSESMTHEDAVEHVKSLQGERVNQGLLTAFDDAVHCSRLAGRTEEAKGRGEYTEQDSRFYVSMMDSIKKHRAAIAAAEKEQQNVS